LIKGISASDPLDVRRYPKHLCSPLCLLWDILRWFPENITLFLEKMMTAIGLLGVQNSWLSSQGVVHAEAPLTQPAMCFKNRITLVCCRKKSAYRIVYVFSWTGPCDLPCKNPIHARLFLDLKRDQRLFLDACV
jgi:hypothetical protein